MTFNSIRRREWRSWTRGRRSSITGTTSHSRSSSRTESASRNRTRTTTTTTAARTIRSEQTPKNHRIFSVEQIGSLISPLWELMLNRIGWHLTTVVLLASEHILSSTVVPDKFLVLVYVIDYGSKVRFRFYSIFQSTWQTCINARPKHLKLA